MRKKALRILALTVFMCCTYSLYKVPGLYWSFKLSYHHSVIEKAKYTLNEHLADELNKINQEIPIYRDSGTVNNYNTKFNFNEIYGTVMEKNNSTLNKAPTFKKSIEIDKEHSSNQNLKSRGGERLSVTNKPDFPKQKDSSTEAVASKGSNKSKTDNGKESKGEYNEEYENILKEIDKGAVADIGYNTAEDEYVNGEFLFDSEDKEFDLNDINEFQKISENLFKTFPNHQNATKYLIYLCEGKCGGLADRLKGISMVYMMSILTERRFAISMETPCELEHFLQPNILDWRFPAKKEIIGQTLQTLDYFERHETYEIEFQQFDPDPISLLKANVVLMKANQDWTRIFRKLSVSPKRFPQLYQYHSSELLRTIYTGLFKHSNELTKLVDDFFKKNVNGQKLACLHARMGEKKYQRYTYRQILIPLQFMKKYDNTNDYKIMVATDTDKVKTLAKHLFRNVVDTSGPILHIDHMRNGTMSKDLKCSGFMRTMVDHVVLQRCDKLILTGSGFGVTAGSIRHTSRGLHVYMKGEAVMPTRRELVRETFQWRCLASSLDFSKFYRNICDS